jgi:signal transduction histidine kinase
VKIRNTILFQILLVALFSTTLIGLILIQINYKFYIEEEIKNLFREAENLSINIKDQYLGPGEIREKDSSKLFEEIKPLLLEKKDFFIEWGINFDIYRNSRILFSLSDNTKIPEEVEKAFKGKKTYIIRTAEEITKLYIALPTLSEYGNIVLGMNKDISGVVLSKKKQNNYLVLFLFLIFIILNPLAYLLSLIITKPIRQLISRITDYKNEKNTSGPTETKIEEINKLQKHFHDLTIDIDAKMDLLKEESRAKEIFIDKLNHELNTPITSIIGFSELLINSTYNKEVFDKRLLYIQKECKRIANLNNNLQKLLLPLKDHRWEELDMREIINEAWNSLRQTSEEKRIVLNLDINRIRLEGNSELLYTLVKNLLHNAIKASYEDGEIRISDEYSGNRYQIFIHDFGIGICDQDLPHIIEPYYTGENQNYRSENKGLGLSICNEIMSYHHGSLQISKGIKNGTVISLDFTNILHSH